MRFLVSPFKKISGIDYLVGVWLAVLVLATSWSLFRPEFFRVHDYVHGARIAELVRSAQAGHLPVRWTENFGFGYGMPLFEFYAPLPYYLGGLIYWLTGNLVLASKTLFFLPNLGAVVGGYLLGRILYGRKGGVIVATAFALAPYRAVNLFVRGAVSESWGMMTMPFVLWAGVRLIRAADMRKWLVLVASLVVLFLSHNLSTLMFVPVSLLFLVVVAVPQAKITGFKSLVLQMSKVFAAYLLAIGLASFYIFPALVEKNETVIGSILSGYFYYAHHFLYIRQLVQPRWGYGGSAWGPDDGLSFFLGYGQLAAVVLSSLLVVWQGFLLFKKMGNKSLSRRITTIAQKFATLSHFQLFVSAGVLALGALFLTLLKSEWWWQHLPLITYIQFPWRWLSVAGLFIAIMAGYGAILISNKRLLKMYVVGLVLVMSLNMQYFKPESYLGNNSDFYYSDANLIRTEMSSVLPDYIPVHLKLAALATPDQATQGAWLAPNPMNQLVTEKTKSSATEFSIAVNRPHQKLVDLTLANPGNVEFAVAAYPGWRAEVDGQPAQTETTDTGLVAVPTPAGKHTVGIDFGSTPVRFWSDLVSCLSVLIVLFVTTPLARPKKS